MVLILKIRYQILGYIGDGEKNFEICNDDVLYFDYIFMTDRFCLVETVHDQFQLHRFTSLR